MQRMFRLGHGDLKGEKLVIGLSSVRSEMVVVVIEFWAMNAILK